MQYLINRDINKIKKLQILNTIDNFECSTIIKIWMQKDLFINFQTVIDNFYVIDCKRRLC